MATTGYFVAVQAESVTTTALRGLKVLEDENGVDMIKLMRKTISKTGDSDVETTIKALTARIDSLEKYIKNMPAGKEGPQGEPGPPGPQGPRGKDGVKTLAELTDVCMDGRDDGSILMFSSDKNKWVMSNE